MSDQQPTKHRIRHRTRWAWATALLLAGTLGGAGWHALPRLNHRLSTGIREALSEAGRRAGLTVQTGQAAVVLPAALYIAPVQVELQDGGRLYAPGVTVGVDLPAALANPRQPARSVRRVEASGVVIRPAQPPDGQPGAPDPGDVPPPGLGERVARARQAVLEALTQLAPGLGWLQAGDTLSWQLDGVWEEPGTRPGETIRTPWRSAGELRSAGPGQVEAEGSVEVGPVRAQFVAAASAQGIQLRRLDVDQAGLRLSVAGSVRRSGDDGLEVSLSGSGTWQGPPGGPDGWRFTWSLQGPWGADGLPPVDVAVQVPPAEGTAGWCARLLGGAALAVQVRQGPEGLELAGGTVRKGEARGSFRGRVADAWPHQVAVEFEAAGLKPEADLPWWRAYSVASVAVRGRLAGSAVGRWTVDGEVQTPSGRLLGLAAGGATAHVSVDLSAGQATVDETVAPVGSGLLTLGARVRWAGSAPQLDGVPAAAWLELRGKVEGVASTEVLQAARSGLPALASSPSAPPVPGGGPGGDVSGSFQAELAWVPGGDASAASAPTVVLVRAAFDGPDGSLQAARRPGGGYDLRADLVNLGGRALRPWLRTWRGYAAFSGQLAGGALSGRLSMERLGVAGYELGSLQAAVGFRDGVWEVADASLRGGDVEGRLDLRLAWAQRSGQASFDLRQQGAGSLGASVQGHLTLQGAALVLEDVAVAVQDREVARASGTVPLTVLGADPTASMEVRAHAQRFPLELVREMLPAWQVEGGRLSGDVTLSGTLQAPDASGRLLVQADRLVPPQDRFNPLTDLAVELRIDGRTLTLARGQARSARGGDVQLTGQARLESVWPPRLDPVDVQLEARQASLDARPTSSIQLQGTFTGRLRLSGTWGPESRPTLSGRLTVRQGRVILWGFSLPVGAGGLGGAGEGSVRLPADMERVEGRPAAAGGIPLDVTVEAEQPVRLEVPAIGGTALAEGAVRLTGTTASPALAGDVLLSQARVRYFGREFAIERGRLSFSPARGLVPEVQLDATTTTPDGPVRVHVEGAPSEGQSLRLSSQPEMSREEILALLLPDAARSGANGRARWIALVNEQLAAWAMGPLEEAVRSALGLDELALVPAADSGTLRLLAGKYLDPGRLYVRYRRELLDPKGRQSLELSYRLRPDLTWRLGWDDRGTFSLGIEWQHSF